ncbi:MAG: hypothetical protein AAF480_12555 [Actinomycetota bacterium]
MFELLRRCDAPFPRPIPRLATMASGLLALSIALIGCGGGPELTASVETMVELESSLQCDITRFAHPDADAVEGYRDEVRARFAVSAEDHRIFLDMLLDDEALRGQVADRADALCPPPAEDEVES